ncbi:MAG: hypothetical protein HC929_18765 [Leptolyngbyaceae cyanobacterium SM2_5_2]|nr:hypothetical protein [Leptolyngbyaceae cyanobacterium SM2_5_2]
MVERYPNWRSAVAEPSQPDWLMIYHLHPDGGRGALLGTETGFDVRRDRPWYQQAIIQGGPRWNPIVQHGPSDYLTLTASQPVYDPTTGDLLGVFAVQTRLAYLSEILRQFNLSADSRILITDSAGTMIGISTDEKLYSAVSGTGLRKRFQQETLTTSQDGLIQALGEQIRTLEGPRPHQPRLANAGGKGALSQRNAYLTIDDTPLHL